MNRDDLIVIKTFNTRLESEVAQGYLAANNIKCVIQSDDEGGMTPYPFKPTTRGSRLLVRSEDVLKAQKLLKKVK